jgi:hypothetical protein
MTPWPWHAFDFECDVPPDLAMVLLANQVGPGGFQWKSDGKPFRGTTDAAGFKVTRVIRYRNSFLPVVSGRIQAQGTGSRVHVDMRLHTLVAAFMTFWLGAVGLFAVAFAAQFLLYPGETDPVMLLAPLAMFALGWALTTFGFWFEAARQERMLRGIFEAT